MPKRSTKAGASAPATPSGLAPTRQTGTSLNEGRGISPGDTREGAAGLRHRHERSTKAGHQPRRHPHVRPRHADRHRGRSTKAGASAPATHPARWTTRCPRSSLNEGRGISPGDTCASPRRPTGGWPTLNEGRGISPGDTCGRGRPVLSRTDVRSTKAGASAPATLTEAVAAGIQKVVLALNEGRGISPGDTLSDDDGSCRDSRPRSTKAGASAPATLLNSAERRNRGEASVFHGRRRLASEAFSAILHDYEHSSFKIIGPRGRNVP